MSAQFTLTVPKRSDGVEETRSIMDEDSVRAWLEHFFDETAPYLVQRFYLERVSTPPETPAQRLVSRLRKIHTPKRGRPRFYGESDYQVCTECRQEWPCSTIDNIEASGL